MQRGTTVVVSSLFKPLPVRRKELERNAKREFGKALNLLYAYALVACANENRGVRLAVSNQLEGGYVICFLVPVETLNVLPAAKLYSSKLMGHPPSKRRLHHCGGQRGLTTLLILISRLMS